ncbi:MAG: hypothetical protein QXI32_00590 [Candidatus Bathyarchaeia archaeon]
MLTLILVESALELVPENLRKHPSVKRNQSSKRKLGNLILDRSYHHTAMRFLKNAEKRGRPDIVHFCLLNALGTPLNKELMLRVYVHTIDDKVISIAPETRLPRNYERFKGLMEQLYRIRRIPPEGKPLLEMKSESLDSLLQRVDPSVVIALSVVGRKSTPEDVIKSLIHFDNPVLIVGGFPRGHFSDSVTKLFDNTFSIDPNGLDAWIVVSRLLYEFEKQITLPAKRWSKASKNNLS